MNTSRDYLLDLAANPHSTVGDVAARLKAKETAVSTQFRRFQETKRLWIEGDRGKPERFSLTEAGKAELQKSSPAAAAAPAPAANPAPTASSSAQPSGLRKWVAEAAKELGLLSDEFLSERIADLEAENAEMEKENRALLERALSAEEVAPNPEAIELYAVELALAFVSRSVLRSKKEKLLGTLPEEVSAKVARLVELEKQLAEERDSWWGVDEKRVSALESESRIVRAELGFEQAEGEESQAAEPDDESPDPDDEFLR